MTTRSTDQRMSASLVLVRIFSFFSSLYLAVIIILSLAILSAIGTYYESKYDAQVAQKLVYNNWPMAIVMTLLMVNLTFVMIDRWPWKKHHTGFILAHIGIIILIVGSMISYRMGIDGTMIFGIGESSQIISLPGTEVNVYTSFDGQSYTKLYSAPVDFFMEPPSEREPKKIELSGFNLAIDDYYHYALGKRVYEESSDPRDGPALRFQLENPNVNMTQWLFVSRGRMESKVDLGPATIVLSRGPSSPGEGNRISLEATENGLQYRIETSRAGAKARSGFVASGETVETGWMGLSFRVLKYMPHAKQIDQFDKLESPSPLATSAVRVKYQNETYWVGQNSVLKLFSTDKMFLFTFAQKQIPLGFRVRLNKFNVGRYQGTMRAASYESEVEVEGLGQRVISMNEPLKHEGYTFYQASFQEDENGRPTASVLSVNYDPGRGLKYLGSLFIVLGAITLFYFKRRAKVVVSAPPAKALGDAV